MVDLQLAHDLRMQFGLDQVRQTGATQVSSLYNAVRPGVPGPLEVEVFHRPVAQQERAGVDAANASLGLLRDDALFKVFTSGITDANALVVVREAPTGTPLSSGIRADLGGIAALIDRFHAAGRPELIARSIAPEYLFVQRDAWPAPVKAALAGPAVGLPRASEESNRRAFAEVVARMSGFLVDDALLTSTSTCAEYWQRARYAGSPADTGVMPAVGVDKKKPSKRNPWPWVAATIALLAGAGAAGYFLLQPSTEPWAAEEAEIAEAFPDVVSAEEGGRGYQGMTCHAVEPGGVESAKVRCADKDLGVSILRYSSADERDAALPESEAEHYSNGNCSITTMKLEGQSVPAYYVAPDGDLETYLLLVNGDQAESQRLQLPIC